ncbi:uncharacterized protein [Dysidea avara]|uniref:uncharacterized protein isoform X3 n=1 Tax=Dysidea avara TaxID=196820 RepID=UPI0033165DBA
MSTSDQEHSPPATTPTSPRDVFTKHYYDFNNIIQIKNFADHFVSRGLISIKDKANVSMESLMSTIDKHLESGISNTLYEMLDVIKMFGNSGEQELAKRIEHELHSLNQGNTTNVSESVELFNVNDRVEDMFLTLFSELSNILKTSKCDFALLRSSCIKPDMPFARGNKLPTDFVNAVDATINLTELLQVLNKSPYCNWLNIRVLEKMAAASLKSEATTLIKKYKEVILSKKVSSILEEMPDLEIPSEFYVKVKDKWNKDFEDITVKDIAKRWSNLLKIFDVKDLEVLLDNLIKGSIEFHWLIPLELMSHVRYSAFRNWYELKDVSYLSIGDHVIKDDCFDFNEECLSVTTATPQQVIDHFTDFLLVSLNDQLLLPLMVSHGLLTDHDLELINSGPTGYHKNQLILTCVQILDDASLVVFSRLLQDSHPDVKIPLQDALNAKAILSGKQSLLSHATTPMFDSDILQIATTETVKSRKRRLSPQPSDCIKYFKCSAVSKEFLKLTDKLNDLMKSCDPKMIIDQCSSLMASDIHNISVFPDEFIKNLQRYNHTPSLLKILSSFWTWSDHSILRTLLRDNDEALKLLDEYDSQLDPLQNLSSYLLPSPSPCMTPCDGSTHTVMAIKCAQQYHQCHLKHVFDVRSLIINKCDITPHCPQLLATNTGSTVLYWLIPKSVAGLISGRVVEYSSVFYDDGILEVSIFPGTRITTNVANLTGPLVFLSSLLTSSDMKPVDKVIAKMMSRPEEIPEVVNKLLSEDGEDDVFVVQDDVRSRQDQELANHVEIELQDGVQQEVTSTIEKCYSEQEEIQTQSEMVLQLEEKVDILENLSAQAQSPKPPPYDSIVQSSPLRYSVYSNVITHHKLGTGVYGTTYRVSSSGEGLAGKILHSKLMSSGKGDKLDIIVEQFKKDCSFLFQIQHPNLVKFVGIYEDTSHTIPMILNELEVENLNVFLKHAKDTLTVPTKLNLSHDMVKGLDHLHTYVQIVHKNLHASNILVSRSGQAKISDFAISHIVNFDEVHLLTEDNLIYVAPEVLENYQNTSYQSDMFSLGILNLQLIIEASPLIGNYKEIQQGISKYEPLCNLIQGCLSDIAVNRPGASIVCQQLEEVKKNPTTIAYDVLNSKTSLSFIEALKSGRYSTKWTTCKRLEEPMWWGQAVTIGPDVYVYGGNSGNSPALDVLVYHVLEDTWEKLPPSGVYYSVPVITGNKLTIVGGKDRETFKFTSKVLTFDVQTQAWINQFPDLLTAKSRPGVVVYSHYLIVAGGKISDEPQFSNEIEILDIDNPSLGWKKSVVDLPLAMWDLTVSVSEDLYWILSYGEKQHSTDIHHIPVAKILSLELNMEKSNDSWIKLGKTKYYKSTVLDKNLSVPVLCGGETKDCLPSDAICIFDHDKDMWKESTVAALRAPRAYPAVSLLGQSAVIVIGGSCNAKEGESENYSLADVEIGTLELTQ